MKNGKKDLVIRMVVGLAIMLSVVNIAFTFGVNSVKIEAIEAVPMIEAEESPFVWIDDRRFYKDSTVDYSNIYNEEMTKIGEYIELAYGVGRDQTKMFVECLDTEDYGWKEYKDSFIMAFREQVWE